MSGTPHFLFSDENINGVSSIFFVRPSDHLGPFLGDPQSGTLDHRSVPDPLPALFRSLSDARFTARPPLMPFCNTLPSPPLSPSIPLHTFYLIYCISIYSKCDDWFWFCLLAPNCKPQAGQISVLDFFG